MSTKIYTGVKITFEDKLWERIEEIRSVCEKTFDELNRNHTEKYLSDEYSFYVQATHRGNTATPNILFDAFRKFKEEEQHKDPLQCKVHVFPPDEDGNHLGYVVGDDMYHQSLIDNLDYVSDYSYWNNTDQHDDITDEEWGTRAEKWKFTLDAGTWVGSTGISVELPATKIRTFDFLHVKGELHIGEKELRRMSHMFLSDKTLRDVTKEHGKPDIDTIMDVHQLSYDSVRNLPLEELIFAEPFTLSPEQIRSKNPEDIPLPHVNEENLENIVASLQKSK